MTRYLCHVCANTVNGGLMLKFEERITVQYTGLDITDKINEVGNINLISEEDF